MYVDHSCCEVITLDKPPVAIVNTEARLDLSYYVGLCLPASEMVHTRVFGSCTREREGKRDRERERERERERVLLLIYANVINNVLD
jgi:hypothetical protein